MKRSVLMMVGVIFAVCAVIPASAQDVEKTVENLVNQACYVFKEKGRKEAVESINNPSGPFVKGDLYVFAVDMNNKIVAHPFEKTLRGLNIDNIKDATGEYSFRKFRQVAMDPGSGWVSYTWQKPNGNTAVPKRAYIKKVPDAELYVGVGYYLQ